MTPKWLSIELLLAIHSEAVSQFGGASEVRDRGLLESALQRPQYLLAYGDAPTIHELAAAYCAGIVRNHPFMDGNKRTGDLAIRAFLFINGHLFEPTEAEEVAMIMGLAAGEVDEAALAHWIADNSTAKPE